MQITRFAGILSLGIGVTFKNGLTFNNTDLKTSVGDSEVCYSFCSTNVCAMFVQYFPETSLYVCQLAETSESEFLLSCFQQNEKIGENKEGKLCAPSQDLMIYFYYIPCLKAPKCERLASLQLQFYYYTGQPKYDGVKMVAKNPGKAYKVKALYKRKKKVKQQPKAFFTFCFCL